MKQSHMLALALLLVSGNAHAQSEQPPNAAETPTAPELPDGIAADQLCSEDSENLPCWVELDSPSGCYASYWVAPVATVSGSWSGECADGFAFGRGTIAWTIVSSGGQQHEFTSTGTLVGGKPDDFWQVRHSDSANNFFSQGQFIDGEATGHWMLGSADGSLEEGPYVDGERNGRWVYRTRSGDVREEGPYVDGERHGEWTFPLVETAHGVIGMGQYVNGTKNGLWVERGDGLSVDEGQYADGERNGEWTLRYVYSEEIQRTWQGSYISGKRNGYWSLTDRSIGTTTTIRGLFIDDAATGIFIYRSESVDRDDNLWHIENCQGPMANVDYRIQNDTEFFDAGRIGRWTCRNNRVGVYVVVEEGEYVNGLRSGRWTIQLPDGSVGGGHYLDGDGTGRWIDISRDGSVAEGNCVIVPYGSNDLRVGIRVGPMGVSTFRWHHHLSRFRGTR